MEILGMSRNLVKAHEAALTSVLNAWVQSCKSLGRKMMDAGVLLIADSDPERHFAFWIWGLLGVGRNPFFSDPGICWDLRVPIPSDSLSSFNGCPLGWALSLAACCHNPACKRLWVLPQNSYSLRFAVLCTLTVYPSIYLSIRLFVCLPVYLRFCACVCGWKAFAAPGYWKN